VESDIRDSPAMSRFEMPPDETVRPQSLTTRSRTAGSSCSARRCGKSCRAWGTDRDWRMGFLKRCDAMGKE
jgi:hypothetical protein